MRIVSVRIARLHALLPLQKQLVRLDPLATLHTVPTEAVVRLLRHGGVVMMVLQSQGRLHHPLSVEVIAKRTLSCH